MQNVIYGGTNHFYGAGTQVHHHYADGTVTTEVKPEAEVVTESESEAKSEEESVAAVDIEFIRAHYEDPQLFDIFVMKLHLCSNARQVGHLIVDELMVQTNLTSDLILKEEFIECLVRQLTFGRGSSTSNIRDFIKKVLEEKR